MLRQATPPRSVRVRRQSTAILASLSFEGAGTFDVVVKHVPVVRVGTGAAWDARQLAYVHERIRSASPRLALCMPRIVGWDADDQLIVMELIPGVVLPHILPGCLRPFRPPPDRCLRPIREAGELLAEIHALPAAEVGIDYTRADTNAVYLPRFEANWRRQGLADHLPVRYRDPGFVYGFLRPDFPGHTGGHLVPADAQPKNVVVADAGRVCFIDPGYAVANPAIGLAQFLVGFDQLGLKWPFPSRFSQIAAWQREFLEGYFRTAARTVADDLVFFYPFVLHQGYELHVGRRPWKRWYLKSFYANRLKSFLANLERIGLGRVGTIPHALFDSDRPR